MMYSVYSIIKFRNVGPPACWKITLKMEKISNRSVAEVCPRNIIILIFMAVTSQYSQVNRRWG